MEGLASSAAISSGHFIIITTAKALSSLLFNKAPTKFLFSVKLILGSDLNNLTAEYELVLSHLLSVVSKQTRLVGFSAPLLDATDLAAWVQVDQPHTYAFKPSSRPSPIETSFTTFSMSHSQALLKAMIKPAYDLMRGTTGTSMCLVSHHAQCYAVLADLLTHSASELDKFVSMDEETLGQYTARIADPRIGEALLHGFAMLSEGMNPSDQAISKFLFQSGAVRVLIVPREACYNLTLSANLVVVMGTQYAALQSDSIERRVLDYSIDDLLQMQTRAIGQAPNESGHFHVFTQPNAASVFSHFLTDGVPLESSLPNSDVFLHFWLSRMLSGEMCDRQRCLEDLSTTYLLKRLESNPTFYGCEPRNRHRKASALVDVILETFKQNCLVRLAGDRYFSVTAFGEEVVRRRFNQARLEKFFAGGELALPSLAEALNLDDSLHDDLDTFSKRLPKSLQRRMYFEDMEKSSRSGMALVVAFFAKKLPGAGSELEEAQARLAIRVLDSTAES